MSSSNSEVEDDDRPKWPKTPAEIEMNRILDYAKWAAHRDLSGARDILDKFYRHRDIDISGFYTEANWFSWTRLVPPLAYNLHVMKGYTKLLPFQEKCLEILMHKDKVSLLALSPTGSGKTAAFSIPAIQIALNLKEKNGTSVLILSNTMNLAYQTHRYIKKLTGKMDDPDLSAIPMAVGLKSFGLYRGGSDIRAQKKLKSANIIVATMGKLLDAIKFNRLNLKDLQLLILDEADKMVDEAAFGFDVHTLLNYLPSNVYENLQVACFTATFDKFMDSQGEPDLENNETMKLLYKNKLPVVINATLEQSTITQRVVLIDISSEKPDLSLSRQERNNYILNNVPHYKKLAWIRALLQEDKKKYYDKEKGKYSKTAVIFVNTVKFCNFLVGYLDNLGFDVLPCTSQIPPEAVQTHIEALEEGKIQAIISTNKLSRGQDIQGLYHVIMHQLPTDFEEYKHRIGRAGRLGRRGKSTVLVDYTDEKHFSKLYDCLVENNQKIPEWLFDAIKKYRKE